jgi:hypothetical protein
MAVLVINVGETPIPCKLPELVFLSLSDQCEQLRKFKPGLLVNCPPRPCPGGILRVIWYRPTRKLLHK